MHKSNTALGAAFALLLSAAMVLFQGQSAIPGAGTGAAGGGSVSLTSTQVAYGDGANAVTSEAAFTYTAASNRLNVDTIRVANASPGYEFVSGAGIYSGGFVAGDISFLIGGGSRFYFSTDKFSSAANDAYDLGATLTRFNEVYLGTGGIVIDYTDSTGSPGAATINKASGSSAIASGAASAVITNNKAATTSRVFITNTNSNACTGAPWIVTKAAGSFTVTAPTNCTVSAATFDWRLEN